VEAIEMEATFVGSTQSKKFDHSKIKRWSQQIIFRIYFIISHKMAKKNYECIRTRI